MIDTTLTYIKDLLNENFRNEFSISENKVVLSNIVNANGAVASNVEDKVVFFLLNLDEEAALKNNLNRSIPAGGDSYTHSPPVLHLNMQVIFCANFTEKNYAEGLRYLSSVVRFFQSNKKIISGPAARTVNGLNFELCKLDYGELSHLWSAVGSKLMPAVVYKVGLLLFDDVPMSTMIPAVTQSEQQ